jgi:hypothetical protein
MAIDMIESIYIKQAPELATHERNPYSLQKKKE